MPHGHPESTPSSGRAVLFVPHGSSMFALRPGAAGADARPKPFLRGISNHVIGMDGYAFH